MTTPTNSTSASPPTGSTLTPLPSLIPSIPDAWTLLALPIVTYWSLSLLFHWIDINDFLARYRLHTPEEVLNRNHVTRFEVVRDVIVQQVIQTIVGGVTAVFEGVEMVGNERAEIQSLHRQMLLVEKWAWSAFSLAGIDGLQLEKKLGEGVVAMGVDRIFLGALEFVGLPSTEEHGSDWRMSVVEFVYWYILPVVRIWLAIFILDTWQYFLHRAMHESKWLYKTFHSRHHRLYVPYAFGALYNHPFEGLLMDTIGAGLGYKLSGLRTRGAMVFFCFSTLKTVDDHCGYSLPWDPLQKIFWNNAGYHDVHHQSWGIKTNYSQPFLICWDRWLGTQWTGDVSARYAASRAKAAAAVGKNKDKTSSLQNHAPLKQKEDITNIFISGAVTNGKTSLTNGTNGTIRLSKSHGSIRSRVLNGKPPQSGREQVGSKVVEEEIYDERSAELSVGLSDGLRSQSRRIPRVAEA